MPTHLFLITLIQCEAVFMCFECFYIDTPKGICLVYVVPLSYIPDNKPLGNRPGFWSGHWSSREAKELWENLAHAFSISLPINKMEIMLLNLPESAGSR